MSRHIKIKEKDRVKVVTGKDRGKTGTVLKVFPSRAVAIVEKINVCKKTMKKRSAQDRGGIIDVEQPIHISNLMVLTRSGDVTRIGYEYKKGEKERICRKTKEVLS